MVSSAMSLLGQGDVVLVALDSRTVKMSLSEFAQALGVRFTVR